MPRNNIKEQSLSGFKWNAIGRFFPYAVQFVIGLTIARLLEPENYGVIGMLSIFMAIAQSFVDSGFGNALIRKNDRTEVDCSTVFYSNIAIACLFYGILFFSAPYIAAFYDIPVLTEVTRVLSLTIVIHSLGIVPRALRSIAVDFKSQAYASVISVIVSGLVGLYLAFTGYGVWALVWQSVVSASVSLSVICLLARWKPLWAYSWASFDTMFSYGSKLLASRLLNIIYRHASSLVIGKCYTPAELGYYDRGFHLATLPSLKLSDTLHSVTFPILAKIQDDHTRLILIYQKYMAITSLVIFFLMMLLAGIAKPLILILLTEKWVGAVPFLQIFCLAFMFDSVCRLNNNMFFVKGWSGLFFRLEMIKKMAIIPVFLLAIPCGVMAICCVALVHTFVDITCSIYCIHKFLGVGLREYAVLVKYFLLSMLACAPAFALSHLELSPWLSLPAGVVTAMALYGWFLHKDEYMREMLHTVGSIIREKR